MTRSRSLRVVAIDLSEMKQFRQRFRDRIEIAVHLLIIVAALRRGEISSIDRANFLPPTI